jgi:hypothetical protein
MTAFGDLFPTATLKWNSGVNNFMTYLTANVPIGVYDVNRQATVGMGRWALDGGLTPTSTRTRGSNSPPSPASPTTS